MIMLKGNVRNVNIDNVFLMFIREEWEGDKQQTFVGNIRIKCDLNNMI